MGEREENQDLLLFPLGRYVLISHSTVAGSCDVIEVSLGFFMVSCDKYL